MRQRWVKILEQPFAGCSLRNLAGLELKTRLKQKNGWDTPANQQQGSFILLKPLESPRS